MRAGPRSPRPHAGRGLPHRRAGATRPTAAPRAAAGPGEAFHLVVRRLALRTGRTAATPSAAVVADISGIEASRPPPPARAIGVGEVTGVITGSPATPSTAIRIGDVTGVVASGPAPAPAAVRVRDVAGVVPGRRALCPAALAVWRGQVRHRRSGGRRPRLGGVRRAGRVGVSPAVRCVRESLAAGRVVVGPARTGTAPAPLAGGTGTAARRHARLARRIGLGAGGRHGLYVAVARGAGGGHRRQRSVRPARGTIACRVGAAGHAGTREVGGVAGRRWYVRRVAGGRYDRLRWPPPVEPGRPGRRRCAHGLEAAGPGLVVRGSARAGPHRYRLAVAGRWCGDTGAAGAVVAVPGLGRLATAGRCLLTRPGHRAVAPGRGRCVVAGAGVGASRVGFAVAGGGSGGATAAPGAGDVARVAVASAARDVTGVAVASAARDVTGVAVPARAHDVTGAVPATAGGCTGMTPAGHDVARVATPATARDVTGVAVPARAHDVAGIAVPPAGDVARVAVPATADSGTAVPATGDVARAVVAARVAVPGATAAAAGDVARVVAATARRGTAMATAARDVARVAVPAAARGSPAVPATGDVARVVAAR
ncbi:hypothetical protein [Phytohabitans kaempferiae]|uniref:Alcohol dehydrogenase N-terminal domain-containing protein n=1 Tax=Phytohabitans kaempferiae TaxID=1620943 RepID=A0ABV6M1E9_9ACTN